MFVLHTEVEVSAHTTTIRIQKLKTNDFFLTEKVKYKLESKNFVQVSINSAYRLN